MDILREDQVQHFCGSTVLEQQKVLSSTVSARRPSHVLPVFQLCAEIHAGARQRPLGYFARFRACWDRFVDWHDGECGDGYLVHVGDGDLEDENHALAVLTLPRPEMPARAPDADPRGGREDAQELVLRRRFASLHERAHPDLEERERTNPGSWWGLCKYPQKLAGTTYSAQKDSKTVLDANAFVELLNAMPTDGNLARPPTLPSQFGAAQKRIDRAFAAPYGGFQKLIVPLSVLIEAEGVTWKRPSKYQKARAALFALATGPEDLLWSAFELDGLSLTVLDAFLHLHERLEQTPVPREHWPRLGDALVFAHGLVHGCPVASAEWTDPLSKKNTHWRQAGIDGLFPFLRLG